MWDHVIAGYLSATAGDKIKESVETDMNRIEFTPEP